MFHPQGFWYPGAMQPPAFHRAMGVPLSPNCRVPVRAVWAANLDVEMIALRAFAPRTRYVAFAVHYPGVVIHGGGDPNTLTAEQRYATVRANVDALRPLQVGVAVGTDDGLCLAWEFNLAGFDRAADAHAAASVDYLAERGMDFDALRTRGIPLGRLADALRFQSGLLPRPDVAWIAYAGAYHAAYLVKVITGGQALPGDVAGFLGVMREALGGDVYDVARVAADCQMPVGLERVAGRLGLAPPLGSPGLAGAGAVFALHTFLSLKAFYVVGGDVSRYRGLIHGLQVT